MSLSNMVATPFIVIFGIFAVIIMVIFAIPLLAGTGIVDPTNSANLTSAGSALSESMAWFGVLVASGITLLVIGGSRR